MENNTMNCPSCGGELQPTRIDHHYIESGLSNLILHDLPAHICARCDEVIVEIPRIEKLHRLIAVMLADKPAPLSPAEVRFLRKYLGYSNRDFACQMGVSPETASRWASESNPMRMSGSAERLLRLLVKLGEQITRYEIEPVADEPVAYRMVIEPDGDGWRPLPAAA